VAPRLQAGIFFWKKGGGVKVNKTTGLSSEKKKTRGKGRGRWGFLGSLTSSKPTEGGTSYIITADEGKKKVLGGGRHSEGQGVTCEVA